MSMRKEYIDEMERLGWYIQEYDDCIDIWQNSPAGEDFFFTIGKENIVREIREYADNFDADEHAEMWVRMMHTISGVPQSIRALFDDADAIQDMLNELADALEKIE